MLCLPNQNCPHLVRGLDQGMEGLEQGPQTEGLFVGDYQVKTQDLTTITTSTGPGYSSKQVRGIEGNSRQSTRPYRVTHHDRIQDCPNPQGHGMGNSGHVPCTMAWGWGQYICSLSRTAPAPGCGDQLDPRPQSGQVSLEMATS